MNRSGIVSKYEGILALKETRVASSVAASLNPASNAFVEIPSSPARDINRPMTWAGVSYFVLGLEKASCKWISNQECGNPNHWENLTSNASCKRCWKLVIHTMMYLVPEDELQERIHEGSIHHLRNVQRPGCEERIMMKPVIRVSNAANITT